MRCHALFAQRAHRDSVFSQRSSCVHSDIRSLLSTWLKKSTTYRHDNTSQTNVRAQPFTYSRSFPYGADEVVLLITIDDARKDVVCIRGGADCEQDDEEEGLEVEERCLWVCK